ncbi:MAG: hypothetical protein IKT53_04675, partial [Bacteroidaceae bacterium]|nr:hypothetical protein [Bacteroidaceae bacterium]
FTYIYNERSIVSILSKECRACEVIQKLVFEDGGVQNISRMKIYRAPIILNNQREYVVGN